MSERPGMQEYLEMVYGSGDDFPYPEDRLKERVREHLAAGTEFPRPFACCGTEDFLLEDNRIAVEWLRAQGVEITYEEGPGSHEWSFWDHWIRRVIEWMGITSA